MRAIVQRVNHATLSVDGKEVSHISRGFMVLLGISCTDTEQDAKYIAEKLPKLRIYDDDQGKMNLSLLDIGGEILIVSNFTLYAETKGTNRPSFCKAANATQAQPLYNLVVDLLKQKLPTKTGVFHEHMHIDMEADGPVTIVIDS